MIFSGRLKGERQQDAKFQRAIKQSSLAFWNMYLRDDARAWLQKGLSEHFGKLAMLETRVGP
jgi:hypothetical protein